jgi:Spy/CpxP family protein refolding chaperone
MKKLIVSIILLSLLAATTLSAQSGSSPQNPEAAKGQRMAKLKKELNLTDQQVAEMKQIRENGGSKEEVRAVLTPEQQTKMDKLREQAKSQRAGNAPTAAKPSTDPKPTADTDKD